MSDNLDNLGFPSAADLAVETIHEIQPTSDKLPSPPLVPDAVRPEVVSGEWRKRGNSVADEAAGGVRVHTKQEWDEEVMGVPESLKRLLSDPVVRSGVHEQHAEQHDVSGNAASFGVVNLESNLGTDLTLLYVEEAAKISYNSVTGCAQRTLHNGPQCE
jgi:hypothetical protein